MAEAGQDLLSGRRALVTGASTGIGKAFAELLAKRGCHLVVVARDQHRLDELAARLRASTGVEVEVLQADLIDALQLRQVEARLADAPVIDLLVNNAGFATSGRFAELDIDREEQEIGLNVVALARLTRAALPGMLQQQSGNIINVSSIAGFLPGPTLATYSATKAYVTSFSEALHEELSGTGVRVQALCPGYTRTEFQERAGVNADGVPRFAWMTPEAVARISLDGLRKGSAVVVPGRVNRAFRFAIRVAPRGLVRWGNGRVAGR